MAEGGTAVLCQVLSGMGGVGKTQLAAYYARTAWELGPEPGGVDVLIWISASSRDAIVAGYAQSGEELCGADQSDAEQAARAFLAWLQPKVGAKPCRWLVVLDDLTDPAHVRGLWPPTSPSGRTLVTTRHRGAALAGRGRVVTVGLYTHAEAVSYLTDALSHYGRTEPDDELAGLAQDLGYLPLALSQAAAYVIDTLLPCAAYRSLLADQKRKLADLGPEHGALPDDQTATLAATWTLSIERADTLRPVGLARPMLQLAAMLEPNGIPTPVLAAPPALDYLAEHRTPGEYSGNERQREVSVQDSADALRCLHRLSLIDHTPATAHQAVRVHSLIQRAIRDSLPADQHDRLARTAADALVAAWPDIERDTALAQALRANTTALTRCAERALHLPPPHGVLYRTATSLGEAGQVTAARDHYQHLVNAASKDLGPGHRYTLAARQGLARWLGESGDAAGAAAVYAELLSDRIRVLGPDHPDTLGARQGLAHWRGEAGDAAGAAAALAELLEHTVRVLGPDDPQTLGTRLRLAHWQGTAGDAAGAAAATKDLLEHEVRVLGPDHPQTLTTRGYVALWQGTAGDAAGAAAATKDLLEREVRVLGPDHPHTLLARHNLASSQRKSGDAAGAATAFANLLEDMARVLGPDHPHTLLARHGLACSRGEAGDAAGAATAFAELLSDRIRAQGRDHPDTLAARVYLAEWRRAAGDAAGAVAAAKDLLEHMVRMHGPDHPDTLMVRGRLAEAWGEAGDAARAAAELGKLLSDRMRLLGPEHPHTLANAGKVFHWHNLATGGKPG